MSDPGNKGDPASVPLPPEVDLSADLEICKVNEVLTFFKGNVALAARFLGRTRPQLMRFIDTHVECMACLQELRDTMLDNAEMNYAIAVERGDLQASGFILETLGKDRGFSKKKEIEQRFVDAPPTQIIFTVAEQAPAQALPAPENLEPVEDAEFEDAPHSSPKVVEFQRSNG